MNHAEEPDMHIGEKAEMLADEMLSMLEGQDRAAGLVAALAILGEIADQCSPELRARLVSDMRELADELEAADSPKH